MSVVNCKQTADSEEIKSSAVCGFAVIQDYTDEGPEHTFLKLLAPQAGRLPSTVLLVHETSFSDTA